MTPGPDQPDIQGSACQRSTRPGPPGTARCSVERMRMLYTAWSAMRWKCTPMLLLAWSAMWQSAGLLEESLPNLKLLFGTVKFCQHQHNSRPHTHDISQDAATSMADAIKILWGVKLSVDGPFSDTWELFSTCWWIVLQTVWYVIRIGTIGAVVSELS